MNNTQNIFRNITFLLVIFSIYGITVFTFLQYQQLQIQKITIVENTIESHEFSDLDIFEDINLTRKDVLINEILHCQSKIKFDKYLFIPSRPSSSIWQPPKII